MAQQPTQNYKRSWKNLLINKDYQLRMTMVLVGVSALLIAGLGWWVMDQAKTATEVAISNVDGTRCEMPAWMSKKDETRRVVVEEITTIAPDAPAPTPAEGDKAADGSAQPGDDKTANEGATEGETPATEGEETGAADDERARPRVTITSSDMDIKAPVADPLAGISEAERKEQEERYQECELAKRAKVEDLRQGQTLILEVLIGLGLIMVLGLAAYGIKMTHKVAGPLFKISLYLRKLQNNKYDTVYNLRKGDHLVEFYDHFKSAHAGLREMQDEDIRRLKEILEVAEKEGLAAKSPALATAIEDLRKILEDKESSIA